MNRNHKVHEYYNAAGNNSVYKGTSFRCTEWKSNTCYFNDAKYIDFVSIDNCVLMCKQSHVSDEYNRPNLQSVLVDGKTLVQFESAYWTLVLNGGTVTSLGAAIPSYPTDGNTYVLTSYDNKMIWAKVEASAGDGSEAGVSVASDEDSINFTFTLPKGKDGQDGTDGKDGVDGTNGEDGTPGEDGKPGKDGITPTTFLTSYVFRRGVENSEFSAPKGGNFENPHPTVDGTPTGERDESWSDTVTLGPGSVYMSSCTFKSDNLSGNYIWSTPTKLSDSHTEQVEYLCEETISVGGKVCNNAVDIQEAFDHWNGVTYPYQFSTYANGESDLDKAERLWRDAVESAGFGVWKDDDTSDEPYYMARCYSKDNGATWSKWEVVRIKGEKGQNVTPKGTVEALPLCDDMEYKMGDSVVLQSAGNPLDGHMFIHTGDYCSTGNCDCWVDMGYTRGDTIHIKYANVVDKETATEANEFIYFDGIKNIVLCFDSELNFGDYIGISVNSSAESSDNPEDYRWQRWTGQDGWGYEYIYWATKEYKVPGIQNNNVADEEFQKDGYLPYVSASTTEEKWFDDQPMISNDLPYVWRAGRKKVNGKWTAFSDATLCAQFAISIDKVYDFYTISDTEVLCPEYADIMEHLSEEYFTSDNIWYKTLPDNILTQGYTVYNLTVIVYTNGDGQVSCNALYKVPVDGAKLSNVEPYYRLSNSNITPWYNIQKNTLDFKNEHFIYIKIKYNDEYQTNGCTGVFKNWYGFDDLFALEEYLNRFNDYIVIEGVAVFANKRSRNWSSFTQVVEIIGYHGHCKITTIICDSTSVESINAVSHVLYPCDLYLLAPGININIFETLGIIQNVYVPEEYLLDYQFQGWTTSGTLTTSVENKYLWEQDKMTVENADGSTYAIATPPFILSWYESPGYTSYKFIASVTPPSTPFFPEYEGWLDTVPMPKTGESVWVTHAFIYEDGRYDTVWSQPQKLSDSQYFQVEYSNTYDGLTPLPKLEITDGNYESEWRQKAKNSGCGEWNDYVVNAKYMATCHISGQTTTDWTVCKIYGEDAYSLKLSNPVDQCYTNSENVSWNSATTDVELYHGAKKVLEGVIFTYCAKGSTDIQNVYNNTISINGVATDTDYIVTAYVNGVSVATALFRVYHRVSDVDYDLYGLPTEVKYNADLGGYNIQSLLITVRKTDYNGTVTYNTLKELDFSVECYRDDSSDDIKPTEVNGKEYIYLPPNQDAQLFTIKLWDRGTLYDTHYITVVHDGKNGENALHLELTNEYDQVYVNATGKSVALQKYTIKPELYYGKQHITDAKFYWKLDEDVLADSSATLEYTVAEDTEVSDNIIIHVYYGTPESYHAHAKYTIVRLEESYDMDLVVTPTQLVQHTNSKFDYTNISIQIKLRNLKDQSEKKIVNLADLPNGYTLYDNNTELKSLNIPVDSKEHTITLKKGDLVIDRVTVNIVKDGKDGTGIDIVDSYLTAAELETAYLDNSIGNLIKGNAYVVGGHKLYVYGGERKEFNQAFTIIDYKGEDGYSSEQIFILSNNTDVSCPSHEGVEANEWNKLEYCPKGWSDTPLAVHAGAKYCYMAVRRYPAQQLTDGYNLFHGSKDINGTYSNKAILYSSYAEPGKDGAAGASSFKSIVFKRYTPTEENPLPSKPADDYGSYDAPAPAGGEWSDGIPSGNSNIPIFSSYRYFGINGGRNDSSWSDPVMLADTDKFDVEYSSLEKPGDPTGHPNTNSNWGNTPNDPIWMATCTCNNGTWGNWVVTRIKGETGKTGDNGVSASHLELSNEFDQVWVSSNNTSHANQEYSTSITYFEGVTSTKIIPKDVAIISSGCTVTPNATGETPVNSVVYTITPPTTMDKDIHVNFTYNGITKTFTLRRLVGDMDYDLSVTPSTIVKKIDGTVAQDVQLNIVKTNFSGGTSTITGNWPDELDGYAISCSSVAYDPKYCESRGKYPGQFMRISSSGDVSGTNDHYNYFAPISAAKFNDLDVCTVYLLQNDSGWKIIDYVQIEVLNEIKGPQGETGDTGAKGDKGDTGEKGDRGETGATGPKGPQGDKGDKGDKGDTGGKGDPGERGPQGEPGPIIYPAGVFSTEKSYKRINDTIPYVEYNNKYYICIGESTGATPDVDAENWSPMTQFDSVFTKLLVAENGTIGQAVYSGDYMFSQSGTKNDGGGSLYPSTDYQDFVAQDSIDAILNDESENFIPSLLFNFADGSGYLHGGAIKFDSNGIEIGSDVVIKSDVTIGEFSVNKQDNNRSFVYANNGSWGYDTYTTNRVSALRAYVNTNKPMINVDLSNYDDRNNYKKFIVEGCIVGNSGQFVYFVNANKSIPLDQYGVLQYIAISDDEGRFSESYTVKPLNQVVNTNSAYKLSGITINGFPSDASTATVVMYDADGNPWHGCTQKVVGTSFICEDEVYSNVEPTSFTVSYTDSNDLEHSDIDVSNATISIVDDPESNYKIVTINYALIE